MARLMDGEGHTRSSGGPEPMAEPSTGRTRFLAVVPAYNEAGVVAGVVESMSRCAPQFDVIVIDDGSTDDTAQRAAEAGATVIPLPFNLGIGGAVQTGFLYAHERGYDYVVQLDGDGQHDASEVHKLINVIVDRPDVDVVCGSRFLPGECHYQAPLGRRVGIRLFALALTRLTGSPVTDPTSGFRLYNRRAIALFAREYQQDYPVVEAVLTAHLSRLRWVEVPVQMHPRAGGRSSITRPRSFYYMLKVSLGLVGVLLRRRPAVELGDPVSVPKER